MTSVVSFVSGKGGVGKTVISLNVSYVLSNFYGYKVLLIDGSLSTPDVTFLLNLDPPKYGLYEFLTREDIDLEEIKNNIVEKDNIYILQSTYKIKPIFSRFVRSMDEIIDFLIGDYDYIIVDSAAGFRDETLEVMKSSDINFIVTIPETHSLIDAFRGKVILNSIGNYFSGFIVNMYGKSKYHLKRDKIFKILKEAPKIYIRYDPLVEKSVRVKEFAVKLCDYSLFLEDVLRLAGIITGRFFEPSANIFKKIKYFLEIIKK